MSVSTLTVVGRNCVCGAPLDTTFRALHAKCRKCRSSAKVIARRGRAARCDCSRPATVYRDGAWICDFCDRIECKRRAA